MAYKLKLHMTTILTNFVTSLRYFKAYLNGNPLGQTDEVDIAVGDVFELECHTDNISICYSKNGEYVTTFADNADVSAYLPLADYRFYGEADNTVGGFYAIKLKYIFKHPLEGTKPVYKRVNGGWRKQTAYERADGMWVKLSTTDTISFTIDGETWYARSGMTWSEWCNANDYSLNSWHIYGTKVAPLDNSKYIGNVNGDTKIIANSSYTTKVPHEGYDIYVTESGTSYRTLTPYSTNPTTITSGETVTLKFDWASSVGTPSSVTATNCEWTDSYTGTTSGVLTITLSNPTDDVVVNVHWEK